MTDRPVVTSGDPERDAYVKRLVDEAPTLTPAASARFASILKPGSQVDGAA